MKLDPAPVHYVAQDPVCGMAVDPATAAGHVDYEGQSHYFCNPSCLKKFEANPELYLSARRQTATPPNRQIEYTCPMHPEIVRNSPGACPICGMALEPREV